MTKWTSQTTPDDIADFADDPKVRRRRRRRKLVKAFIILGILAGLLVGGKLGYRGFRTWRINQNLLEAEAAVRVEDWAEARAKARSVLLARPGDYKAFRAWTLALSHLNEPRTYMAAAVLFQRPEASREDKLVALRTMVQQAPDAVTLGSFMSLPEKDRKHLDFQVALAPIMTRRGGGDLVMSTLKSVPGYQEDPGAKLEIIRALMSRPEPDRVNEAADLLVELVANDATEEALDAMVLVDGVPDGLGRGSLFPRLAEWISRTPQAKTEHRLLAWHPELAQNAGKEDKRALVFERAINLYGELDPGTVGSWLLRHDQVDLALEFLEEPAKEHGEAYIAWLHALFKAGRETEIKAALVQPPAAADLVEVSLVKVLLARRDQARSVEIASWTEAMNRASFDSKQNRFIEIARFAEAMGAGAAATDAWLAAALAGWGALPMYSDLQQESAYLASQGRSADLMALFQVLLRMEPANGELLGNYLYLALIHENLPAESVEEDLLSLLAMMPERHSVRSSLAFCYLQQGKGEQALAVINEIPSDSKVSALMIKALRGTAKVLSGKEEEGWAELESVDWLAFMRQERRAFEKILDHVSEEELPLPGLRRPEIEELPEEIPMWRNALKEREAELEEFELPSLDMPEMPEVPALEDLK